MSNETYERNIIDVFEGYVLRKHKLRLFKVDTMNNGTIRLQKQLFIGTHEASHILKNGILYEWNINTQNWSPCNFSFEIVYSKEKLSAEPVCDYYYEKIA